MSLACWVLRFDLMEAGGAGGWRQVQASLQQLAYRSSTLAATADTRAARGQRKLSDHRAHLRLAAPKGDFEVGRAKVNSRRCRDTGLGPSPPPAPWRCRAAARPDSSFAGPRGATLFLLHCSSQTLERSGTEHDLLAATLPLSTTLFPLTPTCPHPRYAERSRPGPQASIVLASSSARSGHGAQPAGGCGSQPPR